jgi:hypothetical protein
MYEDLRYRHELYAIFFVQVNYSHRLSFVDNLSWIMNYSCGAVVVFANKNHRFNLPKW